MTSLNFTKFIWRFSFNVNNIYMYLILIASFITCSVYPKNKPDDEQETCDLCFSETSPPKSSDS